jgi:V/A-type H+-transporting ATPase subunit D
MADVRRVPPGRAGRLWLERRLYTARRGVELLDRKLRILRGERDRFRLLADETGAAWRERCGEAETWLLRGALLGGQREVRLATGPALAEVSLGWSTVMGVRYPAEATCTQPEPSAAARAPGNAALAQAVVAYRAALDAAVRHAAADAAFRIVDAEVVEVRRRLHAIADRWVPRVDTALQDLTQRLEELERAETVRLRWAAGRAAPYGGQE